MGNKISQNHLSRRAYIYIRQSTQYQVQNNLESQGVQYGLVERARTLGWNDIEVIDDDQGFSASGIVERQGFERLVASVSLGDVGAIFSIEASRLARNNREWHNLLYICGMVNTLIVDLDGIYDVSTINDRLLLGMKGTMSEFELNLFRQRTWEGIKAKAKRGEYYTIVPIGYILTDDRNCEKDPDNRIQDAIELVFKKFAEMRSARQVLLWFQQEKIELPSIAYVNGTRTIEWKIPVYYSIQSILTHPMYAGAYTFGRTTTKSYVKNGRLRKRGGVRVSQENWDVLIQDHHEKYITWENYQDNRKCINNNANMKGLMKVSGTPRCGTSMITGLLRCGRCGRKMYITYSGKYGRVIRYVCRGSMRSQGGEQCMAFGALGAEYAIEKEILNVVKPAAITAAFEAADTIEDEKQHKCKTIELSLKQACYEADRISRQYNIVEPENRNVAIELEKRWNKALEKVRNLEEKLQSYGTRDEPEIIIDRETIIALAEDIPTIWKNPDSDIRIKKEIVRILIHEIVVDMDKEPDTIEMIIHWHGGHHSVVSIKKRKTGHHRYTTDTDTISLVKELSQVMPDGAIAKALNRLGRKTGHGKTWIQARVTSLRHTHGIPIYDPAKREKLGIITMEQAAVYLHISQMSVLRLVKQGIIKSKQVIPHAPHLISMEDLKTDTVQNAVEGIRKRIRTPLPVDLNQTSLEL